MAHISKAETGRGDPAEWAEGQARARNCRANAAAQLAEMIVDGELTGSSELIAQRVRSLATARGVEDRDASRAAAMDLAHAAAAYAVQIDLESPDTPPTIREEQLQRGADVLTGAIAFDGVTIGLATKRGKR